MKKIFLLLVFLSTSEIFAGPPIISDVDTTSYKNRAYAYIFGYQFIPAPGIFNGWVLSDGSCFVDGGYVPSKTTWQYGVGESTVMVAAAGDFDGPNETVGLCASSCTRSPLTVPGWIGVQSWIASSVDIVNSSQMRNHYVDSGVYANQIRNIKIVGGEDPIYLLKFKAVFKLPQPKVDAHFEQSCILEAGPENSLTADYVTSQHSWHIYGEIKSVNGTNIEIDQNWFVDPGNLQQIEKSYDFYVLRAVGDTFQMEGKINDLTQTKEQKIHVYSPLNLGLQSPPDFKYSVNLLTELTIKYEGYE